MIDALHELVDESEALCVHAPSPGDAQRLRTLAARVHAAVASVGAPAGPADAIAIRDLSIPLAQLDALLALLDEDHDPARWRAARAPLVTAYAALRSASEPAGAAARPRAKPHNLARTSFHALSGVMWALLYEHVLERGPVPRPGSGRDEPARQALHLEAPAGRGVLQQLPRREAPRPLAGRAHEAAHEALERLPPPRGGHARRPRELG